MDPIIKESLLDIYILFDAVTVAMLFCVMSFPVPSSASSYRTIPNGITALRVVLALVICFLILRGTELAIIWAGILLLCAWGTDALDGLLARKMNQSTLFGSIFDLIADRVVMTPILIITIIGGFWQRTSGIMLLNPYPYAIVVIIADMTILAGILTYLWKRRSRSMEFPRPTFVAKCAYSIQMLTLLIGVWGIGPNEFLGILMYLTIFVTLLAFYSYLRRGSYVFTS